MKTVTGDEDFLFPILFLVLYSLSLVLELRSLPDNMNREYSIILTEPLLFTDNILKTITNFNSLFLVPALIMCLAYQQKTTLLKIAFFLASIPCVFSDSVIMKIGYNNLFVLNVLIMLTVVLLIIKYLNNTLSLYKAALKEKNR